MPGDPEGGAAAESVTAAGGSLLAKHTVFNLLGRGVPLLVAFVCLPFVVSRLGPERFGLLAMSWAVVGSAPAFDLGLGRAAARFIAAAIARGATRDVPRILGSVLVVQGWLGVGLGALIVAGAPVLVQRVFALPVDLQSESRATFQVVALAVPIALLSSSLRGALFAAQRFDLVNAVAVPASSSMYVLSVVGALAGWTLPAIVALLVASKAATLAALWVLARRHCPGLAGGRLSTDRPILGELIRFGSWVTVSSVLVPALTQAERVLIPAFLPVAALTFYTVPYEAVSRAAVLPASMALTLFPAFSRFDGREGPALTALVARPMRYLMLVMTPVLACTVLFAHELLAAWMGADFASQAQTPLQLLAVAFYFTAFAHILRAAVQGLGRPDLKGKLDLANAGLFLVLFVVLTPRFGLAGVASAKAVTALTELAGLFVLASWIAPRALRPAEVLRSQRAGFAGGALFGIAVGVAALWLRASPLLYVAVGVLTLGHFGAFWIWLADGTDRRAAGHLWEWLRRGGRSRLPAAAEAESEDLRRQPEVR